MRKYLSINYNTKCKGNAMRHCDNVLRWAMLVECVNAPTKYTHTDMHSYLVLSIYTCVPSIYLNCIYHTHFCITSLFFVPQHSETREFL